MTMDFANLSALRNHHPAWRLPEHRVGRLWKFKVFEVDDWVRGGGARDEDTRKCDGS